MSTDKTQPEHKGFFEKIKETIGEFWDGTKDTAEDVKDISEEKIADTNEKAGVKKTIANKNANAALPSVSKKISSATVKTKKGVAKNKATTADKTKEVNVNATNNAITVESKKDSKLEAIEANSKAAPDVVKKNLIKVKKEISGKTDEAAITVTPSVTADQKSASVKTAKAKSAPQ
ncbi:hypothetical protein A0256_18465 [Mucilaginibacter sp. PAMC 26640]|nr:hypothetical protein A0256_18465 [Mucilaginibacter sp. PAMC 26640]